MISNAKHSIETMMERPAHQRITKNVDLSLLRESDMAHFRDMFRDAVADGHTIAILDGNQPIGMFVSDERFKKLYELENAE